MADAKFQRFGLPLYKNAGAFAFQAAFQLDHANSRIEVIFTAPAAVTVDRLGWLAGAITGTAPTYQISLQGVNSSGRADGTIKSSGNTKATLTPSATGTVTYSNVTSNYAISLGEELAIVLEYSSGTINASNRVSFRCRIGSSGIADLPFAVTVDGNTSTTTRRDELPWFAYGDGTNFYGVPVQSFVSNITFNSGTNPNERGLKFTIPNTWFSQYQLAGFSLQTIVPVAGHSIKATLYTGTDATPANSVGAVTELTVAQTKTFASDVTSLTTSAGWLDRYFTGSLVTLYTGGVYRLAVAPQDTSDWAEYEIAVGAANEMSAFQNGVNFTQSTRNGGNWTDSALRRPQMELILATITGGGILRVPAMSGGMT